MVRISRLALALGIFLVALLPATASAGQPKSIFIALDVSGSMRGAPLDASVAAANRLLQEIDRQFQLDIYIFNETVTLLDSARNGEFVDTSRLATLTSGGFTSLYDAIGELSLKANSVNAQLLILTDGNDSRSRLTQEALEEQLSTIATPVHFIAYRPRPADLSVLKELSALTGGDVYNLDSIDQLAESFRTAVTVVASTTSKSTGNGPIIIASATSALSLLALNTIRLWRRREGRLGSWSELLDGYQLTSTAGEQNANLKAAQNRLTARLIGDTSIVAPRVKAPALRESLTIGLLLTLFGLLTLVGAPLLIAFAFAILGTIFVLRLLVAQATRQIRSQFEGDLPGSLKLLASSLSAGLSFLQALDSFSQESKSYVGREFRRALQEIQMGVAVERALGDIADRMASDDLRWVVYAFSVQREVGGSLAKILQTSAETIESRSNLRQEIRTLSAEGRISANILMALPPTIFLFLLLTRPGFISLFWEETIGHVMLLTILALILLAWLWIRRLVRQGA